VNVAVEREDPRSILSLHRRLISLRRAEPALSVGEYSPLESAGDVLAYLRERGDRRLAILLNLGGAPQVHPLGPFEGKVLLSTHLDREGETARGTMDLRPNEGVVLELTVITASGNL
jgi:alpha-glucosidase